MASFWRSHRVIVRMVNRGSHIQVLGLVLSSLLGAEFFLTGASKAGDLDGFAASIYASRLFPIGSEWAVAYTIVALELVVGMLILLPRTRVTGSVVGTLLVGSFAGYFAWKQLLHIKTPCQCFGALVTLSPIGSLALVLITYCGLIALRFTLDRS